MKPWKTHSLTDHQPLYSICSAEHFYQNTEVKNSNNKYSQNKLTFFFSQIIRGLGNCNTQNDYIVNVCFWLFSVCLLGRKQLLKRVRIVLFVSPFINYIKHVEIKYNLEWFLVCCWYLLISLQKSSSDCRHFTGHIYGSPKENNRTISFSMKYFTESQNSSAWKGPLEVIRFAPCSSKYA